jgi:hypothetical protein
MIASKKFWLGGLVAVLVVVTGVFAAVGYMTNSATHRYRKAICDSSTEMCLVSWQRSGNRITATLNRGEPLRYTIGKPSDVMISGNWLCGRSETLAIYRPSTGAVYYLQGWPEDNDSATVFADDTGIKGLTSTDVRISDQNDDGCADLGLASPKQLTWFLPAVQRGRLQPQQSLTRRPAPGRE